MSFSPYRKIKNQDLDPDEIFLDSSNLPSFDNQQFEGRIEKPISRRAIYLAGLFFLLFFSLFLGRVGFLGVVEGKEYAERSENNTLRHTPIFPERGIIYDRNKTELAWNNEGRVYIDKEGYGHLLGYIGYPTKKDLETKDYHPKELIGKGGVEKEMEETLAGSKGVKIEEINALGKIFSDHTVKNPESGKSVVLSIDGRVQEKLYEYMKKLAADRGFQGGGGAIMDVRTGEIIALASFPDYDSNVIVKGEDKELLRRYFTDPRNFMINRVISGLYTPGSVFKPFMAVGALAEGIISPSKFIYSSGELVIPSPYDPKIKTVFKDWKAHGSVDMRRAIAVSSNVYFYVIGGGLKSLGQTGLGISRIEKYAKMFGLSKPTGINFPGEEDGVIPNPEWKKKNFDGEDWRIGDTYHTAIGQYGVLITPIQLLRGIAAIANDGKLVKPTILKSEGEAKEFEKLPLSSEHLKIVREGMRLGATEGTAKALDLGSVKVAAKTGTAELGATKEKVNSWVTGFFPYESPRYAFVVVMEKGERSNLVGSVFVMRQLLDWMSLEAPEYLEVRP